MHCCLVLRMLVAVDETGWSRQTVSEVRRHDPGSGNLGGVLKGHVVRQSVQRLDVVLKKDPTGQDA